MLVTGGAGFIGSHLTTSLLRAGAQVTVVDNLSTGTLGNLPKHPKLIFNKKDIRSCRVSDISGPIDTVIHMAALPSVPASWTYSLKAHESNLTATLSALELGVQLKSKRFLYASSAAVYGPSRKSPVSEEAPLNAFSPYGLQKISSEKYIRLYARRYSFQAVILRLFNVFGTATTGTGPGFVSIAQNQIRRRKPLLIYGDGRQTRDFIYVKDVVLAFEKALSLKFSPAGTQTCNIASGRSISLRALVDTLVREMDGKAILRYRPTQPGDIRYSEADVRRAAKVLGFRCRYSLTEGLRDMLEPCR